MAPFGELSLFCPPILLRKGETKGKKTPGVVFPKILQQGNLSGSKIRKVIFVVTTSVVLRQTTVSTTSIHPPVSASITAGAIGNATWIFAVFLTVQSQHAFLQVIATSRQNPKYQVRDGERIKALRDEIGNR
jgi:hypothetical protein